MHDQLLEPVVAVDHAAIEIVQVRRRKPATVERDERTEIRRDDRDDIQDHPLRPIAGIARLARIPECIDDLEPLEQHLLPMLRRLVRHFGAERVREGIDVEAAEELTNRRRANIGDETGVVLLLRLGPKSEILLLVQELIGRDVLLARLDDDVVRVVDDLLEITESDVEKVAHRTRQRLEEPDVRNGYGELDVTHALAAHLRQRHLDAAAIADHSAIADALVLAAVTLPILHRSEDALAEQPVLLGLERAVVDGLGFSNFSPRPPVAHARHLEALALLRVFGPSDLFWRSDPDLDVIERRRTSIAYAAEINH